MNKTAVHGIIPRMRLLLTNDDGYDCEGLKALASRLGGSHETWIVAPDSERSGASNAITLKGPSKVRQVGERAFTCSGMPADCAILGLIHLMDSPPDALISGINRGPNLGTDLIYSGTAGAARQAAIMGLPGLAVSLATHQAPFRFGPAADFVTQRLEELLGLWKPGVFINLNLPNADTPPSRIIRTSTSRREYKDKVREFTASDGTRYCFLGEGCVETVAEEGSDAWAVEQGLASVTVVHAEPWTEAQPA